MAYAACEIEASLAREYVKRYQYSGKVVANSSLHLGVFNETGELCGVLQYGPPMNGEKTASKIAPGFTKMMELNRMVMRDEEPRNSESQAISVCNRWLRTNKELDYILSFSDGKENNVGYIYQATNWKYLGFMLSDSFYLLDGKYMHSVSVWHKYKEKHEYRGALTTNEIVSLYYENVSIVSCKQHVYVFPLHKKVKFPHKTMPYPKLETENAVLKYKHIKLGGFWLERPIIESSFDGTLTDIFGRGITA